VTGDPRDPLDQMQTALVRALVDGGPVPPGFAPGRIAVAGRALRTKRRRQIERAAPALVAALGETFVAGFAAFARAEPPTGSEDGADAAAFARFVLRRPDTTAPAFAAALAELVRRGLPVRFAIHPRWRGLSVAVRWRGRARVGKIGGRA
jgi:hypothetical protein